MEHLPESACWRLLREHAVGRLGVVLDGAPEIYPLNYVVDGETIVFRTDPGSKVRGVGRSPLVCFQLDSADTDRRDGWSVLVKGRAVEITDEDWTRASTQLDLDFWAPGIRSKWIRVVPTEVTGRQLHRY